MNMYDMVTEMKVNEIFYSIQAEGPDIGMPAIFIRLSGCNLNCSWCDSKFAFNEGVEMTVEEIIEDVCKDERYNKCKNIVITGGEPLLNDLYTLIQTLVARRKNVYVETNGTFFDQRIIGFAKFVVSPKLNNINFKVLTKWRDHATFKFVINDKEEFFESLTLIRNINPYKPVYFMPNCIDDESMKEKMLMLTHLVKEHFPEGRVTPRLQIYLYGNKRGT